MDWTAFAPDFQALPMNIEYVEREDEFDTVVDNEDKSDDCQKKKGDSAVTGPTASGTEEETVDVVTVEHVPAFDSDSEPESDVFFFRTKVKGSMKKFGPGSGSSLMGGRAAAAQGSKL